MTSQSEAARFLELHRPGNPLLLPNPWDQGSARVLASLGFQALATTSSGFAMTLGRLDGSVTRDEALAHAAAIVAATDLPVSADLENCFAGDPAGVARTVALAGEAGLAGCSIEDFSGDDDSIYDLGRRPSASRPPPRRPTPGRRAWCSPRGPRTTCTGAPTWRTPSPGCRRTRPPAPTCCTRRA